MKYPRFFCQALSTLALTLLAALSRAETYPLEYHVRFIPELDIAEVRIVVKRADKVKRIDFNLSNSPCAGFSSHSPLKQSKDRLRWRPEGSKAELRYQCRISNQRKSKHSNRAYDARMTKDWALFRGDDLVPPASVVVSKGWESSATLFFELPKSWAGVNTEWPRDPKHRAPEGRLYAPVFSIDDPERRFDRPTGWMIAGELGTRRMKITRGDTQYRISVSAPRGSDMRRMDILTFLQFAWPEFEKAFGTMPREILIVGGDDPMWRGGLSAGNSFYMHASRPIVSENGTSTLLHEMFHMVAGVRGKPNHDWIAEGLAEFYGIELMRRAGGIVPNRHANIVEQLTAWSKDVKRLQAKHSRGATTAAATLVFMQLDEEIRAKTQGEKNLDVVVRALMPHKRVDLAELKRAVEKTTGLRSKVLAQPLVTAKPEAEGQQTKNENAPKKAANKN